MWAHGVKALAGVAVVWCKAQKCKSHVTLIHIEVVVRFIVKEIHPHFGHPAGGPHGDGILMVALTDSANFGVLHCSVGADASHQHVYRCCLHTRVHKLEWAG